MLGVLATALFFGDAMITPSLSVLSAVEGLTVVEAGLEPLVVPISIGILIGLFLFQSRGTAGVGALFGPIVLVYMAVLATMGVSNILAHPEVLAGAKPALGRRVLPGEPEARLPRDGIGVPRRHGRRDALRRHGPFRPAGGRMDLARPRLSVPDAQLHGPGGADDWRSLDGSKPVFPDGAGLGCACRSSRWRQWRRSSPARR